MPASSTDNYPWLTSRGLQLPKLVQAICPDFVPCFGLFLHRRRSKRGKGDKSDWVEDVRHSLRLLCVLFFLVAAKSVHKFPRRWAFQLHSVRDRFREISVRLLRLCCKKKAVSIQGSAGFAPERRPCTQTRKLICGQPPHAFARVCIMAFDAIAV